MKDTEHVNVSRIISLDGHLQCRMILIDITLQTSFLRAYAVLRVLTGDQREMRITDDMDSSKR